MKIVILVHKFPPKWLAGTEIATYNIAKYLVQHNHEVYIITSYDLGLPKKSQNDGITIYRLKCPEIRFVGVVIFWINIVITIKKIHPDLIHCQSIYLGIPGLIAKKLIRIPYLVWGRGLDVYSPNHFMQLFSKCVLKHATAVIALTHDMKKSMKKIYNRQITVIPNGIDLTKFLINRDGDIRPSLSLKSHDIVIIFVGRLGPEKGLVYLIKAIDSIRHYDNIKLLIIGAGSEEIYLKNLTKKLNLNKKIFFIGKIENTLIPDYMIASDIFILPSINEGFPNVIIEAMASGLPVIATNIGGIPEIILDGHNGFLVDPKNPDQLAEKISILVDDENLRLRIGKTNKIKVNEFSFNNTITQLESIYKQIVLKDS